MSKNPQEELKTALNPEEDGQAAAGQIKKVPLCPKALVHDVVQFDPSCLDFLHKLGEGGFGVVRACKFRRADLRGNSPAGCSTATTMAGSDDEGSCASGEE